MEGSLEKYTFVRTELAAGAPHSVLASGEDAHMGCQLHVKVSLRGTSFSLLKLS